MNTQVFHRKDGACFLLRLWSDTLLTTSYWFVCRCLISKNATSPNGIQLRPFFHIISFHLVMGSTLLTVWDVLTFSEPALPITFAFLTLFRMKPWNQWALAGKDSVFLSLGYVSGSAPSTPTMLTIMSFWNQLLSHESIDFAALLQFHQVLDISLTRPRGTICILSNTLQILQTHYYLIHNQQPWVSSTQSGY